MALEDYNAKRDFRRTPEPPPRPARTHRRPTFVIQEHHASRLHYDFRLEADGVLKSWAVPKEPSLDPSQKRLAVRVEDHPLAYASFKGTIPAGQYGAGHVAIWDHGTYDNLRPDETLTAGIEAGRVEFALHGEKLQGRFQLIRMKGRGRGKENWLLIKGKDEFATTGTAPAPPPARPRKKPARAAAHVSRAGAAPGEVAFTHPGRVLFPESGITKGDVLDFYRRISDRLLPFLRDRPVTLERLPEGLGGGDRPHFWQKNTPTYYPKWVPRVTLETEQRKKVAYTVVNDLETLLYLTNQGTLTFHVWFSRLPDLDRPDFVLFDLDPGPASFADVVAVAKTLHGMLKAEKAEAFVKTSGKTGLHVLVPWEADGGYDQARAWALGVAHRVAEEMPDRTTVEIRKAKRDGRVYIDVMQNVKGHHAVPPYVLRAVPGAPVSTPLRWTELDGDLDPKAFTLKTIFRRLARQKSDPWAKLARRLS